jgi:hypothetical protein
MDLVQEASALLKWFSMRWVCDGGEIANCSEELASMNKVGIERGGCDMLLIAKAPTSKNAVEFERVKVGPGFARRWHCVGWNGREIIRVEVQSLDETCW